MTKQAKTDGNCKGTGSEIAMMANSFITDGLIEWVVRFFAMLGMTLRCQIATP